MLEEAFAALKTYDWGTDRTPLQEIDKAVIATRGDDAQRKVLELQLAEVLKTDVSRDAKDYVCRKLMLIGTAASVPALADLLSNKDLSHMARYALERNPSPEALQALRDALPKLSAPQKIGIISSLGSRRDGQSVDALGKLLTDADPMVARAAATSLGDIRSSQSAKALSEAKVTAEVQPAVTDASLFCAGGLLAEGKKDEALKIYQSFAGDKYPKHVRVAATKGVLACASGKKD